MVLNNCYKIFSLFIIVILFQKCYSHADDPVYCSSSLEDINTRNHFVSDNITDTTGGFKFNVYPTPTTSSEFSTEFTFELIGTKYSFIRGILIYVEHENQTFSTNKDDFYLRIGHFVNIDEANFKPKRCGKKSPLNSTLQHFDNNDKFLPLKFQWSLDNVFDYQNNFEAILRATVVTTLLEWGVVSYKFKPKNIIKKLYPEHYREYVKNDIVNNYLPIYHKLNQGYGINIYVYIITLIIIVYLLFLYTKKLVKRLIRKKKQSRYRRLPNHINTNVQINVKRN